MNSCRETLTNRPDTAYNLSEAIAEEGLKQIATFYRIEGQSAEERLAMRQQNSASKVATFKIWMDRDRWITIPIPLRPSYAARLRQSRRLYRSLNPPNPG
jgi:hypothetical protein